MDTINTRSRKIPFHEKIFNEKTGVVLSAIALVVLLSGIFIFLRYGSWIKSEILDESKMGEFGDFIGGIVGTLVALVGIILYYVALTEQRKDIKINQEALNLQIGALNHQVDEFKAQKEELISTRKIYEQQNKTMRNQQFDSNFYSLLNVCISIKNNLNENSVSHDFFLELYDQLNKDVVTEPTDSYIDSNNKTIEAYTNLYLKNRGKLSPYFKTIYRVIKFVDESDLIKEDEKVFYCKIIRSQISDNELLVLYYNYHSIYGTKAQSLILKYNMLKHIQRLSKIEFEKHFNFKSTTIKNRIILLVEWLINYINSNIEKAKDIERTTPIICENYYKDYGIIIGVYIDVSFKLELIIKDEFVKDLPYDAIEFYEFINLVLHDYFYFERFIKSERDVIVRTLTDDRVKMTFSYSIENI